MSQHRFPARKTILAALGGTLDPATPGLDPNHFRSIPRSDLLDAFAGVAQQFEAGFSAIAGPGSNDDNAYLSPLMAAALAGHFDLADQLIQAGGNIREANPRRITPLLAACAMGDSQVIEWFMERVPLADWHAPTRSPNPYASNVPIDRLAWVNPALAASVRIRLDQEASRRPKIG